MYEVDIATAAEAAAVVGSINARTAASVIDANVRRWSNTSFMLCRPHWRHNSDNAADTISAGYA